MKILNELYTVRISFCPSQASHRPFILIFVAQIMILFCQFSLPQTAHLVFLAFCIIPSVHEPLAPSPVFYTSLLFLIVPQLGSSKLINLSFAHSGILYFCHTACAQVRFQGINVITLVCLAQGMEAPEGHFRRFSFSPCSNSTLI